MMAGWTKRDFIEQAFNEIGLAGYVFDLSPEQLQTALRQLDSMMSTWDGKGIRLGWPISITPGNSDLDTEVPIIPWANEAIYLNLGVRLGPAFGKAVSQETRINAKMAYDGVLLKASRPQQMQYPGTLPAGAGNKTWRDYNDPFIRQPDENPIQVGGNGQLTFPGD